jgi:hypothetical protein
MESEQISRSPMSMKRWMYHRCSLGSPSSGTNKFGRRKEKAEPRLFIEQTTLVAVVLSWLGNQRAENVGIANWSAPDNPLRMEQTWLNLLRKVQNKH